MSACEPMTLRVVRMALRKERAGTRASSTMPYGAFSVFCRALVAHDVLLVGELQLVDRVEQIAHAIGFEPQRRARAGSTAASRSSWCDRNRWCRSGSLPPAASSSWKCASAGTCFEPWNIMCSNRCANPVRPGRLVRRTDVVPDVDGDERQPLILGEDHLEAVRQRVLLERNRRQVVPARCRATTAGNTEGNHENQPIEIWGFKI